jgi:hypothetical protein
VKRKSHESINTRARHIRAGDIEVIDANESILSMAIRRETKWVNSDSAEDPH